MFNPPLTRWERRLLWWWWCLTGCAASALIWGVVWWFAVLIVTIPFVVAAYLAPVVWVYATPSLLAWLLLRRRPRLAVGMIASFWLVLASGVPALMNRHGERLLAAAVAGDGGSPVPLDKPGSVAFLTGWGAYPAQKPGTEGYCDDNCLRFLITARADAVLVGPAPDGTPRADQPYLRFRRMPRTDSGCPSLPNDAEEHFHPTALQLIGSNHCIAMDRAPLGSARLVFSDGWSDFSYHDWRDQLPQLRVSWRRHTVYGWRDGQPVALFRRTEATVPVIASPLFFWPMNGADDTTMAGWASVAERRAGQRLPANPMAMVADRLYVPALDDKGG